MSVPPADELVTVPRPLLRVEDLHVTFTGKASLLGRGRAPAIARAVDGVTLDLAEGEIVALAGESGCGKTSLARAIMGFVRPASGRILFEGEPLGRDLRAYRRKVQMVYQDPTGALNPRQTVYDSVAEGLRIHKIAGQRGGAGGRRRCRAPGCGLRSGSSCCSRTSSRADSGSVS